MTVHRLTTLGKPSTWFPSEDLVEQKSYLEKHYFFENFVVDGKELQVQQNTEYPWDGKINLTVSVDTPNTFQIRLRIPKWAKKTQVFVDGRLLHKHTMEQGYIICDRLWEGETEVVLELEMNPVFIVANPAIAEADGRSASICPG